MQFVKHRDDYPKCSICGNRAFVGTRGKYYCHDHYPKLKEWNDNPRPKPKSDEGETAQ